MAVKQIHYFLNKRGYNQLVRNSFIRNNQNIEIKWNCRLLVGKHPGDDSTKNYSASQGRFNDLTNHHIETTTLQKLLILTGSATISLINPKRTDMMAVVGETTGIEALKYIHQKMESDKEGNEILSKKPQINSRTINFEALHNMPEGTLGKAYAEFLSFHKISPDSRCMVRFVEDMELAYVMQRSREIHDLIHTILNIPTNKLGEVAVKWVEGIQTRLPVCLAAAVLGPLKFNEKQRQVYLNHHLPWAIHTGFEGNFLMNVYFENRWEQPITELLSELNMKPLKIK